MATDKIPEMVERVARQLISALSDGQHDMTPQGIYLSGLDNDGECLIDGYVNFYQLISFVIKAMREPTEAMWDAGKHRCHGVPLLDGSDRLTCGGFLGETPSEQWKRMIDAALGE